MKPVLFAFLYLISAMHIVLSDGTILVTGRSSVHSLNPPPIVPQVAVIPPSPVRALFEEDELVWNKWDVGNFAVLSLDKRQGRAVRDEIEGLRRDIKASTGIELKTSGCKVVVVPNGFLLKKLFGLDFSRHENKVDSDGNTISCAAWLNMEERDQLPHLLLSACARESMPGSTLLALRGVPNLAKSPDQLRAFLSDAPEIDSESLFGMSDAKWNSLSSEQRSAFDRAATLCCLHARRELGIGRFSLFLTADSPKSLGFNGLEDFDVTLERYRRNLLDDLASGRTPDEYLRMLNR